MSATGRKHTVREFTTEFKISKSKTYKLINEGVLTVVKVDEKTIIDNADAWYASLPRGVMEMPKGLRRALDDRRSARSDQQAA
jgi:hypothetical protein